MLDAGVNVWLVNTGWTGGPYGVGTRMKLKYTRAMIHAALSGELGLYSYDKYHIHSVLEWRSLGNALESPQVC